MNTINQIPNSYRKELIEMAISIKPTHSVTLNLHRDSTLEHAVRHLKRWRVEIMRRMHGRRFYELRQSDMMEFVGCPERSLAGHPHFHLLCRVPLASFAKFECIAAERWKAIIPSGTSHIEAINVQPENIHRVMNYATKHLDANSAVPFVHSSLLH